MQNKNYRGLKIWQKSIDLVTDIYTATQKFPTEELYGLVSQIRRAAVSVPSNIAEGYKRYSLGEFKRYLKIASGSLAEVETQLLISRNLKYIGNENYEELISKTNEIDKMMGSLAKKLT